MENPTYPKLVGGGVLDNGWLAKPASDRSNFIGLGLIVADIDPPDTYILSFIDTIFWEARWDVGVELKTPENVAKSLGKPHLTFVEYVAALAALGMDTEKLHAEAAKRSGEFHRQVTNSKMKAKAFFDLLQTEWHVTDAQIKEHIDDSSIYELLELVLAHSDITKARINASKRHTENRSMKSDVFTWLDSNMPNFKSMDAAAQAITRQQPIAFRTARDWVGEWKKVRSASTP